MDTPVPERLYLALLTEMVNGSYSAGDRFLSHRIIRQRWRVADITVMRTIAMLRERKILKTVDRSGNYLSANFRHLALLAIDACASHQALSPLPLVLRDWRSTIISKSDVVERTNRIAIILVAPDDIFIDPVKGHTAGYTCAATALAIGAIQRSAGAVRVSATVYLYNGKAESRSACLEAVGCNHYLGVIVIRRILSYPLQFLNRALEKMMLSVVTIFSSDKKTGTVTINFNNISCGYNAASALYASGHRNLATITTSRKNANDINSDDRIYGFSLFKKKKGKCNVHNYVISKSLPAQDRIIKSLLKSKTTAVFCVGVAPTLYLADALKRHSLSVPSDLSLISCSAIHVVKGLPEPLDILHLDFSKLGEYAFEALVLMLDGKTPQRHILFSPPVVRMGSVVSR